MDPERRLDVRVTLILSLLALTLYLPGITGATRGRCPRHDLVVGRR